jgi:hypothetical protein
MPMPAYPLICYHKGCGKPAQYKIAARWSDGITRELKTYGLTCETCLPEWFHQSRHNQKNCRLTAGETLETPGIYLLSHGRRDRVLERLPELEEKLIQAYISARPGG